MNSAPEIFVLRNFSEMLENYPLIQQLNPSMTRERYETLLRAIVDQGNYFQIVCRDQNETLGLSGIWIGTQIWCGKFLEIDNFVVDERARGRGIGRRMVEWIERLAVEEKCDMMRLDSYVVADKAHRFYFGCGFKVEGFHMTKRFQT